MPKRFRRFLTGFLALAVLGAGCRVGWAQEAPSSDQAAPPPAAESAAVPLSLEEVLKSALEKNLDIAVRRYDPKISETRIETQRAVFEPSLSLSATADENNSPQSSALGGANVLTEKNKTFAASYLDPLQIGSTFQFDVFTNRRTSNSFFATLSPSYFTQALATYTQPFLRNFGKGVNQTQILIAQNSERISHSQFRQTVMDTLAAAEKAYWDLNFALMNLETQKASLKLAQDFLEQTQVKVRVGTLPPIEITQAKAGVADRLQGVIVAGNSVKTAEDNLRLLMNVPSDSPLWDQPIHPSDKPEVLDKVVDMAEAVRTAMDHRPDMEQSRLNLASKDADFRFRKNQRLYRLDLVAKYGAQGLAGDLFDVDIVTVTRTPISSTGVGDSFDQVQRRDFTTWSAQLVLGIPLGNRAADAAYAAAEYGQSQSRLTIQKVEQQARVEVRNAVRQLQTNLESFRAAQQNTKLQREKLDAEQKKYENGMSTAFQILQFQTDLTTAQSRENQAIVDYNKSLVELDRVLGILIETRNVSIAD